MVSYEEIVISAYDIADSPVELLTADGNVLADDDLLVGKDGNFRILPSDIHDH